MKPGITVAIPSLFRQSIVATINSVIGQKHLGGVHVIPGGPRFGTQRNHALAAAETEYVFFTDDDCVLDPRCLEHLYELATRRDLDMVFPRIDGGIKTSRSYVSVGAGTMVKTEFGRVIRYAEEMIGFEDMEFGWRCFDAGADWDYCPDALVYHIGSPQNSSYTSRADRLASLKMLQERHAKRYAWLMEFDSSVLGIDGRDKDRRTFREVNQL